ncbi:hypothetical protein GCM10009689_23580 [Brevibacterium antiquum]
MGQNVVVEPYIIGEDVDTSIGESYQLSQDMNFIGLGGGGGGLSEKIVVQRQWAHPIGEIPLDQAPSTIELVRSGKIDLSPFITGRIGLDELVSGGFDELINNNEQHVKIIVDPRT